jgi:CSLREA domain-containing protein
MKRSMFVGVMGVLLWAASAAGADFTEIRVNTTHDIVGPDGYCSLREAIQAVNWLTPIYDCPKGTKKTIIVLPAGYYPLDHRTNDVLGQGHAPLVIYRGMHIQGAGPYVTTLDGLTQGPLFTIGSQGTRKVILDNMSLTGGFDGAIQHGAGPLAVRRLSCAGNLGGCYRRTPTVYGRNPVYFEDVHIYGNTDGHAVTSSTGPSSSRTPPSQNGRGLAVGFCSTGAG